MKRVIICIAIFLVANTAFGQISGAVLSRVIRFKEDLGQATAFTIEVDGHQYIITAKHNLKKATDTIKFKLFLNGKWSAFTVDAIYPFDDDADMVALGVDKKVTVETSLGTEGKIGIGQQVYFVGYPYGLSTRGGLKQKKVEFAFVKAGVLSAIDARNADKVIYYVDGAANPGFSGGPLVVENSGKFHVFGVIKGHEAEGLPVVKKADLDNPKALAYKDLHVRGNTGIVVGHSISHIIDAIKLERSKPNKATKKAAKE